MNLDQFLQALLPHDKKFFALFERLSALLLEASEALQQLPKGTPVQRDQVVRQIQELEHRADDVAHEIFDELNSTFVTPFDREDIHTLTSALDDVMDCIHGCTNRFVLYKVTVCPPEMARIIDILHDSIVELRKGVALLPDIRKPGPLQQVVELINKYENDADTYFERAIAELFENEKDPMQVIKLKEIYVALETATDKCEDAANVMESILIKNS
jgi:hypothetical protein